MQETTEILLLQKLHFLNIRMEILKQRRRFILAFLLGLKKNKTDYAEMLAEGKMKTIADTE